VCYFLTQGQAFNGLKNSFVQEVHSGMTGKPTATYNTCNTYELAFNVPTKPALLTTGTN